VTNANQKWTPYHMMIIEAARALAQHLVCFVGIGAPSAAANLCRLLYNPDLVLIYESGCIGSKPSRLPLSIGDGELASTADTVVSMPEIFNYWLQAGRIEVGFLGAAQIDKYANINTTVIGDYNHPKVRLPGAGGAPEIASFCQEVYVMLSHSKRAFVEKVDFVTTLGHGYSHTEREEFGFTGKGPTKVITDLCIMEPDPTTKELIVTSIHPGVTKEQIIECTGWSIEFSPNLTTSDAPTEKELTTLLSLLES
jgi:glutaconate CoA-transferase subunit B